MNALLSLMPLESLVLCFAIAVFGGLVKGLVGFALPLILISGMGSFIDPELALAGLLLPVLVSNLWQAFRQGVGAAFGSLKAFTPFLIVGAMTLVLSAQFVRAVPDRTLFLLIGIPVVVFTCLQFIGWRPRFDPKQRTRVQIIVGALSGAMGGMSGTWGPPTVLMLTALNTPKDDQMRIQGVLYGLGAVALVLAHVGSGVLRTETLPFAVFTLPPSLFGMWIGFRLQHRIDHRTFQRMTQVVLIAAGLNLIRRALMD